MTGGYKILDFKGKDFTSESPEKIDGAFDVIERSNKVTLIENFSVGGKEYQSVFIQFVFNETDFEGKAGDLSVKVASDDNVTFTVASEAV